MLFERVLSIDTEIERNIEGEQRTTVATLTFALQFASSTSRASPTASITCTSMSMSSVRRPTPTSAFPDPTAASRSRRNFYSRPDQANEGVRHGGLVRTHSVQHPGSSILCRSLEPRGRLPAIAAAGVDHRADARKRLGQTLEPVLVTDAQQAYGLFGAGSILADMVALYRRNDNFGTVWAIPHLDPEGATAAELTDTIAGSATGPATMGLYIGGERYAVTIAAGDDAEVIAQKIAAAVNADPFALVTAEAAATAPSRPRRADDRLAATQFDAAAGAAARRQPARPRVAAARAGGQRHLYRQEHGRDRQQPAARLEFRGVAGGESIPPGITIRRLNGDGNGKGGNLAGGAGLPDLRR